MSHLKLEKLEAKEIVVSDGEYKAVIRADPEGVGIWLVGKDASHGNMVSVSTVHDETTLAVYSPGEQEVVNLSIILGHEQGNPCIRIIDKGKELKTLYIDDLREMAALRAAICNVPTVEEMSIEENPVEETVEETVEEITEEDMNTREVCETCDVNKTWVSNIFWIICLQIATIILAGTLQLTLLRYWK